MQELKKIAEEIKTQDNRATDQPIFILFDHEKVPTDSDYSDNYIYCYDDGDYCEIGTTRKEVVEFCRDNDVPLPKDIEQMDDWDFNEWVEEHNELGVLYFIKKKVFRQCFFTEKSAKEYLEANRHHFKDPLIHCDSLWRNNEMQAIRNALMDGKFVD